MFDKNTRVLALLALAALLSLLSGCGTKASAPTGTQPAPTATVASNLPDSVQIRIGWPDPGLTNAPLETLSVLSQVQQFYQTTLALPLMPQQIACTDEAGPQYGLTFLHGKRILAQIVAKREGCDPVTISGEAANRRGSMTFWEQLDQAIYIATPVARPQALAIQHTLQGNQPVQTAHITDIATAQRLYGAILSLPRLTASACSDPQYPPYQLVFQAPDQAIPAVISQKCNTVSLNGNNQSRSGLYTMTAQFKQFFTQILASASFAPAQPDQLTQSLEVAYGTSSQGNVTDINLIHQLYAQIFTLPESTIAPSCPFNTDKMDGKARWHLLDFTQWGLPVMNLMVYEGTCDLIQPSPGLSMSQTLSGDATFWSLLRRASPE